MEKWSGPWCGTGPDGGGRASHSVNMSRVLAACTRSMQAIPGPDSIKTGTKWWHQSKKSTLPSCHSEFRQRVKVKGSFRLRHWVPAERWLQCLQIYPKVMNKHAEAPKARPKGGGGESKPTRQVLEGSKEDQSGAPKVGTPLCPVTARSSVWIFKTLKLTLEKEPNVCIKFYISYPSLALNWKNEPHLTAIRGYTWS